MKKERFPKLLLISIIGYLFISQVLHIRLGFVDTGSMNPVIETNSFILSGYKNYNKIEVGDVIVFTMYIEDLEEEIDIVHRVVEKSSIGLKTKGDNNDYIDDWIVEKEDIMGKVFWK